MPRDAICSACFKAFDEDEEGGHDGVCEACFYGLDDGGPMIEGDDDEDDL